MTVTYDYDWVEFYLDENDETRWRYRSGGNGEVMADSGEGYSDRRDAATGAARVTHRNVIFNQDAYQFSTETFVIFGVWVDE